MSEITITRRLRGHRLTTELWLPKPVEDVFDFFCDVHNLEQLTPPSLSMEIVGSTPDKVEVGSTMDYRLKIHGVPMRWRSEFIEWNPPHRFADRQVRGPYRQWRHVHSFTQHEGGTLVADRVDYAVPGGPLAPLIHKTFVKRDIRRIFEYRRRKLREIFEG